MEPVNETLPVDPAISAFAQGLGKFAGDIKAITGPGAAGGATEVGQLLSASVTDLVPALGELSAFEAAFKVDPAGAVLAIVIELKKGLGV